MTVRPAQLPPPFGIFLLTGVLDTVITFHEDQRSVSPADIVSIRSHILNVLRQISSCGISNDPITLQSVRHSLDSDESDQSTAGIEGASNLFYYLFDDWYTVYAMIDQYSKRLQELV